MLILLKLIKNPFNIGWRIINLKENSNIKKIIPNKSCFYFCHSYFMSFNTSLEKKNIVKVLSKKKSNSLNSS